MGNDCCDPTQLPRASKAAARRLMDPNHITIPGRSSVFSVEIDQPAVVQLATAPAANLYAYPDAPNKTATLTDSYSTTTRWLRLPVPGKWFLYYDTTSAIEAVILAAPDDASFIALSEISVNFGGAVPAVRNADADADGAAALLGFLGNSRNFYFDPTSGDWKRVDGGLLSNFNGAALASHDGPNSRALVGGRDTAGTGVIVVTADRMDTMAGVAANGVYAAAVASLALYPRETDGVYRPAVAVQETSSGSVIPGGMDVRESAYWSSLKGRRFRITPGRNVIVTGTNAYAATTPSVLIVNDATEEFIIRKIDVILQTLGTFPQQVFVVIDPDDRFSAGGTSRTPVNVNGGSAAAWTPTYCLDGNITATAEDADERDIEQRTLDAGGEKSAFMRFEDGLILPPSGSLLIYVVGNGGTAPTFHYMIEGELANVQ